MAVTGGTELVRTVLPVSARTLVDMLEDPQEQ